MRYRSLGNTGLSVSEIGFGGWGIGSELYGEITEEKALATLNRAYDGGITYFDTAPHYGEGLSERLIGRAFEGRRGRVVIATKWGSLGHHQPDDFSPALLRQSLESSLQRLRTHYVDVLQVQCPPMSIFERDDLQDAMDGLVRAGKVRFHALACLKPEDGLWAIARHSIQVLQCNINLLDPRALDCGLLDRCRDTQTAIVARTPLCFGFLTGRFDRNQDFPQTDHRAAWPAAQRRLWGEASRHFAELYEHLYTPAQFALAFCLSLPGLACVIPGMMSPEEAKENMAVADLPPLTDETRDAAIAIFRKGNFFLGNIKTVTP
jgi:aryl-alcohol dehydrogenase-like predicted oxidoreductase